MSLLLTEIIFPAANRGVGGLLISTRSPSYRHMFTAHAGKTPLAMISDHAQYTSGGTVPVYAGGHQVRNGQGQARAVSLHTQSRGQRLPGQSTRTQQS